MMNESEHKPSKSFATSSSQFTTYTACKKAFEKTVSIGPSYVCTSCYQTWFRHSVFDLANVHIRETSLERLQQCTNGFKSVENREWICRTCLGDIKEQQNSKTIKNKFMSVSQETPRSSASHLRRTFDITTNSIHANT